LTSNLAGHIAAGVYEVPAKPTIIVGVYGNLDNNDRASIQVMEDLRQILREVFQVYHTQRVMEDISMSP
jgi:hypothetical protein